MAVNSTYKRLLLILMFLASITYANFGIGDGSQAIIEYAKREVMVKTSALGERINLCDKRRDSTPIPVVDYAELKRMGVSRQQAVNALAHLSSRNYAMCEKGTREALAYALGTLSTLAHQYNVDINSIEGIEENLIYPSSRDIERSVEFAKLHDEAKKLLLHAVGDQPFDLMRALQKNGLNAE